jgi:branched-chain amino acid transport system ATP-binding protein
MSESVILETGGLTCSFGELKALDGVDLRVPVGAAVAVVGPNGSGKSTLLNVISGFVTPDAGTVTIGGRRVERDKAWRIAGFGVRRTFQQANLPARMTVLELLVAGAALPVDDSLLRSALRPRAARAERRSAVQEARRVLAWLELPEFENHCAGELSGGQQKLVGLGAALIGRPRLLLLDEPMAGVNPALRAQLATRLRELQGRGMTVMLVEHDMKFVASACDQVYVLDRGAVVARLAPQDLAADPEVRRAYLGEEPVAHGVVPA